MRSACSLLFLLSVTFVRADDSFEKDVRPLLLAKCVSCHGPEKQKAGLRLDSKAGWQTGGERGPAIVPGKPKDSLLIQAVTGAEGVERMPPKEKLTDREIAILSRWVKGGAVDPREGPARLGGMSLDEAKKWWSFQAVKRPAVETGRNAVDAFIDAQLAERSLKRSPPADRRTLIRRATYDLTGLPPTADEVDAFLKDDSPQAFAKVVDRLLASPHYGERWGRHWLDLARYADTAGETSDHPLPHAWRYRNWVIDAFNRDLPYDEFVREQIAGDILAAQGPSAKYAERIVATGYLALARRFDFDIDKSMHLTHEDGIDTLGKAFLGLTLGCARCHDHKYDAISSRDYYALYGIFESTRFSFPGCEAKQQPRDMVPLVPPAEWDRVVKPYREKMAAIEAEIRELDAERLRRAQAVQATFVKSRNRLSTGEIADGGDKRFEAANEIEVKAGEVLLLSILPLKNHGADTTLIEWEITSADGKRRWSVKDDLVDDLAAGNPHADRLGNSNVWWLLDVRNQPLPLPEFVANVSGKVGLSAWRNGETPSVLVNSSKEPIAVWTKLPARSLFVHPAQEGNVAIGWLSPITGKVRVSGRIQDAHPGGPDGVGWMLEHIAADVRADLLAVAAGREKKTKLENQRTDLLRNAPRQDVAFAVVEGKAADARIQLRGDPEKLGEQVPRRWLQVLGDTPISTKTGSGRIDLANWIAAKDNPLTARVIVNRIWLHHFGKGLVKTPNDFGARGSPPTHPGLLDWLAAEFIASGWSIKTMHRTIMLSETYQQAVAANEPAASIDPNNDRYWRFDRRRLSAEEIRDSMLVAGGNLDRKPAEAHPFPPESAWSYTQHVPFSTFFETNKRSVYLVNVRNRRHPFLGLFDGADPNATTPQRQTTTVPTQALYFLNDPFFHAEADRLAVRVLAKPDLERLDELYKIALQRAPSKTDREFAERFLERYRNGLSDRPETDRTKAAWSALGRVVLASNEYLFVE